MIQANPGKFQLIIFRSLFQTGPIKILNGSISIEVVQILVLTVFGSNVPSKVQIGASENRRPFSEEKQFQNRTWTRNLQLLLVTFSVKCSWKTFRRQQKDRKYLHVYVKLFDENKKTANFYYGVTTT